MAVQQPKRGSDGSRTLSERINIALASHSNRPINREKPASLRRPYARRNHDSREIVTALDDERQSKVSGLVDRGARGPFCAGRIIGPCVRSPEYEVPGTQYEELL